MNKSIRNMIATAVAVVALVGAMLFAGTRTISASMVLAENYNKLIVTGTGTEANPIMVDGNGMTVQCLEIRGQWIYVENLIVDGCSSHGVLITGQYVSFSDSIVRHTNLSNSAGGTACSGADSWGSAIKIQLGGEYVSIKGNQVYENCGEGIAVTRGKHVSIQNNVVRDNYSVNIYVDNSSFVDVINNDSVCTGIYLRGGLPASGIGLGIESYPGWGNQMHDIHVLSNRITGCRPTRLYVEVNGAGPSNTEISYNVFTNVSLPWVNVPGAVTIGNAAGVSTPPTSTLTPIPASTITPTATATKTKTPAPMTAPSTRTPTVTPTHATWTPSPTRTPTATATAIYSPTPTFSCFDGEQFVVCVRPK